MQVLLLSRGDAAAKDLLRRALAARYGFGAPALDTLKLTFKGRARVKVARMMTWVPLEASVYFRLPISARWEFSMRPVGLPINAAVHAFDGERYRKKHGDRVEVLDSPALYNAMRDQVWASTLMMLSPMAEPEVEVKREGERTLTATRLDSGTSVKLFLNDDYTLEHLEFPTVDPETAESKLYRLNFNRQQIEVDGIAMPSMITMLWNDEPQYELIPLAAEINATLSDAKFQIAD